MALSSSISCKTCTSHKIEIGSWSESACFTIRDYSSLCYQISERLPLKDFQILKRRSNNILYKNIAKELDITPYTVRKQLNSLISTVSQMYAKELFEFARMLDLFIDDQNGETDFKNLKRHLRLGENQLKILILLSGEFLKMPVHHFQNRVYRIKNTAQ